MLAEDPSPNAAIAAPAQTLPTSATLQRAESAMLRLPQVECPVVHHFGPGVYIREVTIPAGTLALGHAQRFEHLNVMLKGRIAVTGDDGALRELVAPLIFVGKPGRKAGYVLEDVVWLNVYATDERDIDVLEATYLDKSEVWSEVNEAQHAAEVLRRDDDREDYQRVLAETGFSHELARAQAENQADQVEMPQGWTKVRIRTSAIEGQGVFVSAPVEPGEVIAPARIDGMRTPAGRFTNHAMDPNARMVLLDNGDIDLVATRLIAGCLAGGPGEEVTIDYRQALALSGVRSIEGVEA